MVKDLKAKWNVDKKTWSASLTHKTTPIDAIFELKSKAWKTSDGKKIKDPAVKAELTKLSTYLNSPANKLAVESLKQAGSDHVTNTRYGIAGTLVAAGLTAAVAFGVHTGLVKTGEQTSYDAGFDAGNQTGYPHGFDAGNKTGYAQGHADVSAMWAQDNATEHSDLEQLLTNNTHWNNSTVNITADKMFAGQHNLSALNGDQLTQLFGALMSDSGALSTTAAIDATKIILGEISSNKHWNVTLSELEAMNLNLIGATKLYASLTALDAEAAIRTQAEGWNATQKATGKVDGWNAAAAEGWNTTWYNTGKKEILDQAAQWNNTQYNSGKAAGWNAAAAENWNATWLGKGKAQSLAEVLGIVDDVLNQTEIKGAGGNISNLLSLYAQKVQNDALWLTDYNADYVIAQTNSGNHNDTEKALGRLDSLYGGVWVNYDNSNRSEKFLENLTAADNKELIAAGFNVSDMLNSKYDLRFSDTYGDGAVISGYQDDNVIRGKVSQGLMKRVKDWSTAYEGGQ